MGCLGQGEVVQAGEDPPHALDPSGVGRARLGQEDKQEIYVFNILYIISIY